jgi:NADH:flavin oxidoreductase / NADH oxidase family
LERRNFSDRWALQRLVFVILCVANLFQVGPPLAPRPDAANAEGESYGENGPTEKQRPGAQGVWHAVNKRDYATAQTFWSPKYIQHSTHIAPGREGLFNLVRSIPATLRYEPGLIVAEGDFVIVHALEADRTVSNKSTEALLTPYLLGDLQLKNRIVMAPLTRTRAENQGKVPNELMAEYYAQGPGPDWSSRRVPL